MKTMRFKRNVWYYCIR